MFGSEQNQPLDKDIVEQKFRQLAERVEAYNGEQLTPQQIAEGFLTIAVDNMANAVKKMVHEVQGRQTTQGRERAY